MSLTEDDMMRAAELERLFSTKFSSEGPFNFSKTISKALELAILQMLQPDILTFGSLPQSLYDEHGKISDPKVLEAIKQLKQPSMIMERPSGISENSKPGKPKKFQKTKRGFR